MDQPRIPPLAWPVAVVAGLIVAGGSLSYSPEGRINILWIWLIWAGLPLLGSLVSLLAAVFGSARPWLFHWRDRSLQWYPSRAQHLRMLWLLQWFWCLVGLGMLLAYATLLVFTDLAFGWSSTLVQDAGVITRVGRWIAWPWSHLWPAAVPDAGLVSATQFQRIHPEAADPARADQWWRFLMASLLVYNLLPRLLLAGGLYLRWRWVRTRDIQVRPRAPISIRGPQDAPLQEDVAEHWQTALQLTWEKDNPGATATFGLRSWSEDETRLQQLLGQRPEKLLWQVNPLRSPVAELADLIDRARHAGVGQQALWAETGADVDPARHLASWRAFAQQHRLVWIRS